MFTDRFNVLPTSLCSQQYGTGETSFLMFFFADKTTIDLYIYKQRLIVIDFARRLGTVKQEIWKTKWNAVLGNSVMVR